jgi:hypothetical protein
VTNEELQRWYELVQDPTLLAGPLSIYALTMKMDPDKLARWLGCLTADLPRLALEPRPSTPEQLASVAVRYGIAADKLADVLAVPMPPRDLAD